MVILLMFTVLGSELSSLYDMTSFDTCVLDTSMEVEFEKETKENVKDLSEFKFKSELTNSIYFQMINSVDTSNRWNISTAYLEIHSPPPDDSFIA